MFVEHETASGTHSASLGGLTHCKGPNKWEDRGVDSQVGANWVPAGRETSQAIALTSVPVSYVMGF